MHVDRSARLFDEARRHLPGGVNSPVRAFKAVGGTPRFIARGLGARVRDVDGNEYLDYLGSWGPLIAGHAHPRVVVAIQEAAAQGTSYGAPCEAEVRLAEVVKAAFPSIERVRFVSSGTEATMSALRLARAFTGRRRVLKFDGCYHGHSDGLLVRAGSGPLTLGTPDSAGVLAAVAAETLSLPFNDVAAVEQAFVAQGGDIAAVIVEPVAGNMGVVPPATGFLESLRQQCSTHGALLVFDEVVTGFRVALGGAQERFGVQPDLTCLGKILGGGLPVGAYGGRADMMALIAPDGPVYQAGTLSGNPLAMAAGLATLGIVREGGVFDRLEAVSAHLANGLLAAAREAGVSYRVNRVGSMLTGFFAPEPVVDLVSAKRSDVRGYARFFHAMLDRGVYLPPSAFEAAFVSLAHDDAVLDRTLEAARASFQVVASASL